MPCLILIFMMIFPPQLNTTIIFKTIGTDSPQAYGLIKISFPAPPFQCCVRIFILFQAAKVSAYSTTTLIGEGAGEGRNCERNCLLSIDFGYYA